MRTSGLWWIVAALIALPAAGSGGTRIKVENTSDPSSRVTISFADAARTPARLAVGDDGVAELVVEAPSPRLRLRGGTLQSDPMIELAANRQLREESSAPALFVVNSPDTPASFAPFDGPLVYDEQAGWWGVGAWSGGVLPVSPREGRVKDSGSGRHNGCDRGRTHAPRSPSPQRTFSARGVIPRSRH